MDALPVVSIAAPARSGYMPCITSTKGHTPRKLKMLIIVFTQSGRQTLPPSAVANCHPSHGATDSLYLVPALILSGTAQNFGTQTKLHTLGGSSAAERLPPKTKQKASLYIAGRAEEGKDLCGT